jgi:hypothetical protein
MKPLLIGLSGKAGSGKSTVGDYLAGAHGYVQFSFAGALKDVLQTAFHFTAEQMVYGKETVDPRCGKSPRWCLQYFGTAFRAIWPEIWIWNLRWEILGFLAENGQHPIVVTDVRFRDEAAALKAMGAVLVRIERPGAGEEGGHTGPPLREYPCATGIPGHCSEIDLDGWEGWQAGQGNHVIDNSGTLQNLANCVEMILAIEADKAERLKSAG